MKNQSTSYTKERHKEIRQHNPDRYFGSDLNKFIYEECGRNMVVNNIDLIMWKYRDKKNHLLRVIESKHTLEKPMNAGQKKVLRTLRQVFIIANRLIKGIDFELFIVKGDQPYDEIEAYDLINHKSITITGKENVVAWLEMN
jgi:hypothetical protein